MRTHPSSSLRTEAERLAGGSEGMTASLDARELRVVLQGFERRARGVNRVLPAVGEALVAAVSDVYEAEGPGWDPLAESTLRQRRGSSAKILQDSGVMAGSTHHQTGGDWAEALAGVDYAEHHAAGRQHLPKRNPFDLGARLSPLLAEVADMVTQEAVKA